MQQNYVAVTLCISVYAAAVYNADGHATVPGRRQPWAEWVGYDGYDAAHQGGQLQPGHGRVAVHLGRCQKTRTGYQLFCALEAFFYTKAEKKEPIFIYVHLF